jgi:hypothetical protein
VKALKNKEIAIVALGGSFSEFVLTRINSVKYDEVWGINCIGAIFHVDRSFMMDPASRFLDDTKAGKQTNIAREFLLEVKDKGTIYSCCTDERVPEIIEYPLEDVINSVKVAYFNNTVAYAIAFAIHAKVKKINLFGIDFSYKQNLHFAEAGRACVEFWCAVAIQKGILIEVASTSPLLDCNVPDNEKLYGYHRLDNPLIQSIVDGKIHISKGKPMSPPEPTDIDPVLIGRHDIPNVTYIEEAKNDKR